jgi:TRAP-type C4-dicarboxylate transport system substrate-binding protein
LDGHDASPVIVLMAKRTWDGLSADQQAAVMTAQDAAAAKFAEVNAESVDRLTTELREAGVTIVPVEDKTPWQEATAGLIDRYGADFPDLVEAIRAADE